MKRIIALILFLYACDDSHVVEPTPTIIYSNEEACKLVARRASKIIDSLIMLRCATSDTAVWLRYEDSIKMVIAWTMKELGGEDKARKYVTTHPYKKIPCMIGDSVFLFYKDYTE